jgi:DNA-binding NtrC family response regulator
MITSDRRMMEMFDLVRSVAPTSANVLIVGENGTGKELVANAVHALGAGDGTPFIKINCAAIPEELVEAELFGHRRGAFTGAVADRIGLFAAARGGTLLLDEIGEMPRHVQAKLLRVLQDREVTPVGGGPPVTLHFRLICATNCDLRAAMLNGRFRQDLYYRINTITIALPPLRERPDDVWPLAKHFAKRFAAKYGHPGVTLDDSARKRLLKHAWRGNVRELEHAIERAVLLSRGRPVTSAILDLAEPAAPEQQMPPPRPLPLCGVEKRAIVNALAYTQGNKRAAAALLGLNRPTLYSKLRKYGLTRPPWHDAGESGDTTDE